MHLIRLATTARATAPASPTAITATTARTEGLTHGIAFFFADLAILVLVITLCPIWQWTIAEIAKAPTPSTAITTTLGAVSLWTFSALGAIATIFATTFTLRTLR